MRAVKRKCPAGTQFDRDLKECEATSLVKCINHRFMHTSGKQRNSIQTEITTQPVRVLSTNSSDLVHISMIEKFLKDLIISDTLNQTSMFQTTTPVLLTTESPKNHFHQHRRRNNRMLNILTSDKHKIEQFVINQTHGLLIHCNEVRRRHLRDLIFHTTTYSLKIFNSSSSKIFPFNIFFLLIFTKINEQ
ncbi:hypothetical protein I4U23_013682 [Adineta vaga]|nr:hypothetical protein I4U23_013682 [Adineta vaga]